MNNVLLTAQIIIVKSATSYFWKI